MDHGVQRRSHALRRGDRAVDGMERTQTLQPLLGLGIELRVDNRQGGLIGQTADKFQPVGIKLAGFAEGQHLQTADQLFVSIQMDNDDRPYIQFGIEIGVSDVCHRLYIRNDGDGVAVDGRELIAQRQWHGPVTLGIG